LEKLLKYEGLVLFRVCRKEAIDLSVAKEELHQMVEALPEKETLAVKRFLEFILHETTAEDEGWLDADLGGLPPYEWGAQGPPKGKPVGYEKPKPISTPTCWFRRNTTGFNCIVGSDKSIRCPARYCILGQA
jgi:hypothetical protein